MSGRHKEDDARPAYVTLTTDWITSDAADVLAAALHAAGVAVERHTFLPTREDVAHPWGLLLLAASGPPRPLARLVAPKTAPPGVARPSPPPLGLGMGSARPRLPSNSRPTACLSLSGAGTLST